MCTRALLIKSLISNSVCIQGLVQLVTMSCTDGEVYMDIVWALISPGPQTQSGQDLNWV